jgi:hypothetical protein
MDKAVHSVSSGWPNRLAVHYVHERNHRGADHTELGFAYHADLLLVSSIPPLASPPSDGSVCVQILLHFLDLHTLHNLPVYVSHSEYNSGTFF